MIRVISLIAYGAESGLFMPEEAKNTSTPKCFRHMISFAFLEVSFIGRIIRVCFAFDFDVSFNGCATGGQQPHLIRFPLVVTCFPEEVPVTARYRSKYFDLSQFGVFVRVSSSCPPPQTIEDDVIHAVESTLAHHVPMIIGPTPYLGLSSLIKSAADMPSAALIVLRMPSRNVLIFFLEGLMSSFPLGYLRTFCPRKSKPLVTCVMTVFVGESSSPRSCRNCSTRGLTSPSSSSFVLPVMTKSSA